jgi:hypothetical protein
MCQPQKDPAPGYDPVARGNILTPRDPIVEFSTMNDTQIWYLPLDCVWQFRSEFIHGIHSYLDYIFGNRWLGEAPKYFNGTMHMRQLYQGANITLNTVNELMSNMTRSMNTVIRSYGSSNFTGTSDAGPARGTMWYTATCVHVRWSWLAFPAAMIGLPAIFLVLVHIESRKTETDRLWKSSILALLFCELDSKVVNEAHPICKSALKEIAKSTSVSLGMEREVLRLTAR